jgi:hypothetical protein
VAGGSGGGTDRAEFSTTDAEMMAVIIQQPRLRFIGRGAGA